MAMGLTEWDGGSFSSSRAAGATIQSHNLPSIAMGTRDFWDSVLHHRGELHRTEGRNAELRFGSLLLRDPEFFLLNISAPLPAPSPLLPPDWLPAFPFPTLAAVSLALAPQRPSHCRGPISMLSPNLFLDWPIFLAQRALPFNRAVV